MQSILITKKSGKYKISRDTHCFVLERLKKGGEWENVGYYSQISSVVLHLVNIGICDKRVQSDIVDIIKDTCAKLTLAFIKGVKDAN